jgi:hypothetical protein
MYLQTSDYVATGGLFDTLKSFGSQVGGAIGQWTGRFGAAMDQQQLQTLAKQDPAYTAPPVTQQPSSSISTTTLLLGGAAVVGLIYFLKKR